MQVLGGRLVGQAQTMLVLDAAGLWPWGEKRMVSVATAPVVVEDGRQQQAGHCQPQLLESTAAAAKLAGMAWARTAECSARRLRGQTPARNKSFLLAKSHTLRSCFKLSNRTAHEFVDPSNSSIYLPR